MQSVVKGALEHTAAAMAGMVTPNKKLQDMQKDTTEYTPKDLMTNDHGVKHGNPNEWLSATSADRQGPALLEDNFGREKVCLICAGYLTMR
jgi:catalase